MDSKKTKGTRLKEIRTEILGLSQSRFARWLFEHGANGRFDEPYNMKTVACWENGRREVPDIVLKTIQKNVNIDGFELRWEYLTGQDEIKTIAKFSNEELENLAIDLKDEIFIKTVFPSIIKYCLLRGYEIENIFKPEIFIKALRIHTDTFIENYIDSLK